MDEKDEVGHITTVAITGTIILTPCFLTPVFSEVCTLLS